MLVKAKDNVYMDDSARLAQLDRALASGAEASASDSVALRDVSANDRLSLRKLPVVDMSRFRIERIGVDVEPDVFGPAVVVRVVLYARDAFNPVPVHIVSREMMSYEVAEVPGAMRMAIVYALKKALLHELDECLYIDGERVCVDPHPELKK